MRVGVISAERLRELLDYDEETGVFTWRTNRGNVRAGSVAGTAHCRGYRQICLDGSIYLEHRMAWLHVYGEHPQGALDHRDRCRTNNRIANLRMVTGSENQQNRAIPRNNTSGFKGVCWDKSRGKWLACIAVNSRLKNLGRFTTPEAAFAAYQIAASELHTHNPCAIGGGL